MNVLSPEITIHSQAKQIFENLDISISSRQEYVYRIRIFLDYIQEHGFNRNSFLSFKRYLQERNNLSVSSKNKIMTVARIYLRELHKLGMLPADITLNVKGFKQTKRHKKQGVSETEVQSIFSYLRSLDNTPKTVRLKAIISLLVLQGWRQIEVIRLSVDDIDFVNKTALVRGKGRDDPELVDLHNTTCQVLQLHLKLNKISDGAVFISRSNNSQNQRMTTRTVRDLVNGLLNLTPCQGPIIDANLCFFRIPNRSNYSQNIFLPVSGN